MMIKPLNSKDMECATFPRKISAEGVNGDPTDMLYMLEAKKHQVLPEKSLVWRKTRISTTVPESDAEIAASKNLKFKSKLKVTSSSTLFESGHIVKAHYDGNYKYYTVQMTGHS